MSTNKLLLAAASGGMLTAAFPSSNLWVVAWVALVPLLWALRRTRPTEALKLGALAGFIHYSTVLFWVMNTMTRYGKLSWPASLGVLVLLAGYLACYVALFAWAVVVLAGGQRTLRWLLAPLAWVVAELARAHVLSGFPWANLGYSQSSVLPVIQIADITGVYGVAFLIVLVNATIVELFENLSQSGTIGLVRRKPGPSNVRLILSASLAVALTLGYGWTVLARPERTVPPETPKLRFALLQGNIPQDLKWDAASQQETVNLYTVLVSEVSRGPAAPQLIVWPETAAPFYFEQDGALQEKVRSVVRRTKVYHLVGAAGYEKIDGRVAYYNRAYLLGPEGETLEHYDKIHLVPFGEYVPLSSVLFFVRRLAEGIGTFYAGERHTIFDIPQGRFGTLICFEVIFPNLVRQFVKGGAQFLVNITNDAWFGRSAASAQHLSMAVFRAVENRVPLIRAANTGITAVVDPFGRVVQATDLFVRTHVTETIPVVAEPGALYTRIGDLFAYACFFGLILVAVVGRLRSGPGRGPTVITSDLSLDEYKYEHD
ncbi:MAG: apolipoprotein N-acyltransferase [Nitrospinae bacterium]|nr:apolipoprotein N-acyltransferase [Nitrospinota bacterium]